MRRALAMGVALLLGPPSPGRLAASLVPPVPRPGGQVGVASWYGPGFVGRPMANTEPFDPEAMTCAHRTLPLGSWIRVLNRRNGRSVLLEVKDRGPYVAGRVLDVSRGAADVLGFLEDGLTEVEIVLVGDPEV